MNKEASVAKINKIGRVAFIITRIAKIFMIIGMVGCLIGVISMCAIPKGAIMYRADGVLHGYFDITKFTHEAITEKDKKSIESNMYSMSNGSIDVNGFEYGSMAFEVDDDGVIEMNAVGTTEKIDLRKPVISACTAGLIYCAFTLTALFFLGFLFKNIETCSSPFDIKVIQSLKNFAYSLIPCAVMRTFGDSISTVFTTGRYSLSFSVDFTTLLCVVLILALAYIFSYGAVLQQESDETL